jgi:hypothetical protein
MMQIKRTKAVRPLLEAAGIKRYTDWIRVYMQLNKDHFLSMQETSYSNKFFELKLSKGSFRISQIVKTKEMNYFTLFSEDKKFPEITIGGITIA